MNNTAALVARWRVRLGYILAVFVLIFARPTPKFVAIGAAIGFIGIWLRAFAAGYLHKQELLTVGGPYAYTRNPLYLGSFMLGLCFTIASARWPLALLFVGIFLGIYFPVMRVESRTLEELFGESYQLYARDVPLFLPRMTPYRDRSIATKFDPDLYMRYREYQAAVGLLALWGVLVFKAYYLK